MKQFFKRIWAIMNDSKYEAAILVLASCSALLLSALLLAPHIKSLAFQMVERSAEMPASTIDHKQLTSEAGDSVRITSTVTTPAPSSSPSPTPNPEPTKELEKTKTRLKATSTERDLYIMVCNADGVPISGEEFSLTVHYPSGEHYSFDSETDGSCYLVRLNAGDYKVVMNEKAGYETAEPLSCYVKDKVEYVQIENVEAMLDVKDVTEVSQSEIDTGSSVTAPEAVIPEVIVSEPETEVEIEFEELVVNEEQPVLDSNGNQTYTYTYNVGPNGFLLLKESQEESNVIPVDEDNNGTLDYGLYYVVPEQEQENETDGVEVSVGGYYVSEILFNSDNTPVDKYDITATPITQTITSTVGSPSTPSPAGWQVIDGKTYYKDSNGKNVVGLKKIDGTLYYFDQYGVRASSIGIDVSFYNGYVNWSAVKAQGIDFAIIRLGGRTWESGELYGDSRTQEYLAGARAAGLKIGAYFYSTAINEVEAVQEASVALSTLNGIYLDYPLFIDMEYSGLYPNGRADNLSIAQRSAIANAFCQTVINGGYNAGVYSGQYFFKNQMDHSAVSQYTIWLASYTSENRLPDFSNRYDIWQFTDRGQINGISGNVDMNVIF